MKNFVDKIFFIVKGLNNYMFFFRSTGLFLSVFFLALVDCTSSVLFLPYMGIFKQKYLNSYLIGKLSCLKKYFCQWFCSWNLISYNFQFPCIGSTKVIIGGWITRFLGMWFRRSTLPPKDHHCDWFSSRSPSKPPGPGIGLKTNQLLKFLTADMVF